MTSVILDQGAAGVDSWPVAAALKVGGADVTGANPVPVTGTVTSIGAELAVSEALVEVNYDLLANAYDATTVEGENFLASQVELSFSTTAPKDILLESSDGTTLRSVTDDQHQQIVFDLGDKAFAAGENLRLQISQTASACLVDLKIVIKKGSISLGGNPVLGSPTLGSYIGDVTTGRSTRDTNNEQVNALGASSTWSPATATRIDHVGSVQMLYASLTPLTSVKIIWYSDANTPLGGLFGSSTIALRQIQGYYVAYYVLSGDAMAPYYKLEIVNGASPQTSFPGFINIIWLNRDAYNGVFDFVDAEPTNLSKALLVKQFHQKTTRLTSTPLGAGGTYTMVGQTIPGLTINAQGYSPATTWADIDLHVWGAPFNARGTLYFYFSHDGVSDHIGPVPHIVNDLTVDLPIPLRNFAYWRVTYVNDTVVQTVFQINITQRASIAADLTRQPLDVIGPGEPLKITRSIIEPSPIGERGILGADRSIDGAAIFASRISRITLYPTKSLASNRVTTADTTGAGAAVSVDSALVEFKIESGTGTTTLARMQSLMVNRYHTNREWYATFPARFHAGVTGATQRAGLFNGESGVSGNGFFLCKQGTTFGFGVRNNGVDTFTPLTSANGDPLDGSFLSRFARGARLEALNQANKNIWRIRAVLHGSSLQFFDVISPDGVQMRVHSNRYPNLQQGASIRVWDLPFRAEVQKVGADATNVTMGLGSVDCGWIGNPYGLELFDVDGREEAHASGSLTNAGAAIGLQIYTVNPGRILRLTDLSYSVANKSAAAACEIQLRDNAAGTVTGPILWRTQCNPTNNSFQEASKAWRVSQVASAGIVLCFSAASNTSVASCTIDGYEEAA